MKRVILTALAACLFSISCASVTMKTPDGFGLFDKEDFYKAVSADGVYLQGKIVKEKGSEANRDLATWETELSRSLTARGYTPVSKAELATADGPARYCEYEVIFNGEIYSYAVLLASKGDQLYTIEAGGRKPRFLAKREAILAAMKTSQVK